MDQTKVEKWAQGADDRFLICRVWQHQWPIAGEVLTVNRELYWTKTCLRCGTEKTLILDARDGMYRRANYNYPAGYTIRGADYLSRQERGLIRLRLLDRTP